MPAGEILREGEGRIERVRGLDIGSVLVVDVDAGAAL
jgi:hypothetical protein